MNTIHEFGGARSVKVCDSNGCPIPTRLADGSWMLGSSEYPFHFATLTEQDLRGLGSAAAAGTLSKFHLENGTRPAKMEEEVWLVPSSDSESRYALLPEYDLSLLGGWVNNGGMDRLATPDALVA